VKQRRYVQVVIDMLQPAVNAMKHEVVRALIDGAKVARNSCLVTVSAIALTKPHQKEVASARKSKPEKTSHDNRREDTGSRAYERPKRNQQAHHDGQRKAQHGPLVAIFRKPAHLISAHLRSRRQISRKAKGFFWGAGRMALLRSTDRPLGLRPCHRACRDHAYRCVG
jgi:hypothetical protein